MKFLLSRVYYHMQKVVFFLAVFLSISLESRSAEMKYEDEGKKSENEDIQQKEKDGRININVSNVALEANFRITELGSVGFSFLLEDSSSLWRKENKVTIRLLKDNGTTIWTKVMDSINTNSADMDTCVVKRQYLYEKEKGFSTKYFSKVKEVKLHHRVYRRTYLGFKTLVHFDEKTVACNLQ